MTMAMTTEHHDNRNSNGNENDKTVRIKKELKSQCDVSIPTILGLVFYKFPWMISLHFAGELGPEPLAAAALATTLCNVTGLSFSVGLSSAITTLTGQARGHLLKKGHEMMMTTRTTMTTSKMKRKKKQQQQMNQTLTSANRILEEKKSEKTPLLPALVHNKDGEKDGFIDDDDYYYYDSTSTKGHHASSSNIDSDGNYFASDNEHQHDHQHEPLLPLVFLYRGLLIQLSIVVPIGIWWITGIEQTLLLLGQAEHLSQMTTIYLRVLAPGLWSYSINWTTTAWLQSIEMADVPAYASFVGFLLHVPFNILYVRILNYGYIGVAMATVSFQILQPLLIYLYLFGTSHGRERILKNSGAKAVGRQRLSFWPELYAAVFSLSGIKQYLELGLPGMVAISEWWASECCIFLAGRLSPNPDYALGAMSIYQSINTFFFMFPIGFSTAASSRVGMFLGRNQPKRAHLASNVSLSCAGFVSLTMGMILFFTPHTFFPSFFTSDENVILQTSYTITFLAFYVFADGLQVGLQGTIKACGKQYLMAPIVIFSYWVVGVPVSYFNTFVKNDGVMDCTDGSICGVRGLIFGLLTGTWIHMLLLAAVVALTIDWNTEALLAQNRMTINSEEEGSNESTSENESTDIRLNDVAINNIDEESPRPLHNDVLGNEMSNASKTCALENLPYVGNSIDVDHQKDNMEVNNSKGNSESESVTEFDDESLPSLANTFERSRTNGDSEG